MERPVLSRFRHNPRYWDAILLQNEGHTLVMGAVDAVGEVACCLGDGDDILTQNQIIINFSNPRAEYGLASLVRR